jgi:integrase
VDQIEMLATAVDPRFRAMVLLASWCSLRFGELVGLQRSDIDLGFRVVTITRRLQELQNGQVVVGPPKTGAGRRRVSIPPHILADVRAHLTHYVEAGPDKLVFTTLEGAPLRRSDFNRRIWQAACASSGVVGFRFHDLRHSGNTLAASTGASTKELMARMGHASARAALIYQHATAERDQKLADALSQLARQAPARLRLVSSPADECSMDVRSPLTKQPRTASKQAKVAGQTSGDDGTRTHDPLLAKQVL